MEFKGGEVVGSAQNNPDRNAKQVLAFMIHSIKGHYKDIVSLVPVRAQDGEFLTKMAEFNLQLVTSAGFHVQVIILDNSTINRDLFCQLAGVEKIEHLPSFTIHPTEAKLEYMKLFLMFCFVHLAKTTRNNWLAADNAVIRYPAFEDFPAGRANFLLLRDIYHAEENLLLKLCPKLTHEVVYVTGLAKQKVPLVVALFHDSTIAGLEYYSRNGWPQLTATLNFLKIFRRWWKALNILDIVKGRRLRDPDQYPFESPHDPRLLFLLKFSDWIETLMSPDVQQELVLEEKLDECDKRIKALSDKKTTNKQRRNPVRINLSGRCNGVKSLRGSNEFPIEDIASDSLEIIEEGHWTPGLVISDFVSNFFLK
eukprot:Lithocolla_globosa_v1_NODE_2537_length_1961_cov_78.116999.p1 type:complete len:367 gc:universal NODE_2537_length_1961_cov_78.116999:1139-39(-)